MMAYNFLQSVRSLADAAVSFTENCVEGIRPLRQYRARSAQFTHACDAS